MQPTPTQKSIIDSVIDQLHFWRASNDINSPTHYCDMDECYQADLSEILTEEAIAQLTVITCDLLAFIKNNSIAK